MEQTNSKSLFKKWLPLGILSLALMIIILDTTILNVSLRTIINDLHTDIQSIQWVITAYSLMLAAFTVTGGRLGDLFGRKKMFIAGAIIFAVGSFITSISQSVGFMIVGEAIIEGIGAALMMPATMSLIVSNYKGRDRQVGFGVWGAIAGGAVALGPVVGGWLTTYYSWRWAFRINVVVVVLLVLGSLFINEARDREEKSTIDFGGIILSSLGLFLVVFGVIKASDYGWITMKQTVTFLGMTFMKSGISIVPIVVVVGLIILAVFALRENYMSSQNKTPLVSLSLFKNSQFTVAVLITTILALGQSGLSFALPIFLQGVIKLDPLATGVAMLPMSLTLLVAAPLSAYFSKYIAPKRIIQIGLLLVGFGFFVLGLEIHPQSTIWTLAPGFVFFGAGLGLMMSQTSNMALSAVSTNESGEASGVNTTLRTVGQTLGTAIMGAILLSILTTNLVNGVNTSTIIPQSAKPTISHAVSQQTSSIEFGSEVTAFQKLPANVNYEITRISQTSTVDATHTTLLLGIGFIILAFLISMKLPGEKNIEVEKSIAVGH